MNYYSLNKQSPVVNFKEATIKGQAPDKGLYFPEALPVIEEELIKNIENISDTDIAFRVIKPYAGNEIPDQHLFDIVKETISFPIPLKQVSDNISSLELFHGPTLAFKDVGARFMSRCLSYFLQGEKRRVTVLVATSGDTGGAVANGFHNVDGVNVVILYPKGRVSPVQEKQLTALGGNITAIEINGSFDDCQQMVKRAFNDTDINEKILLTSANSINVARWLPQQFYYFFAYKQWKQKDLPPVVCVPSGNFGNICAGILAKVTGLPLGHFIAACNVNDVVSDYLQTQQIRPKEAVPTLSNAMDVGNPSNFIRIIELFQHKFPLLKNNLSSSSINDAETMETIRSTFEKHHYTLDPHGAVAWLALEKFLQQHPTEKGFILETAHPVKFPAAVEEATQTTVALPQSLLSLMQLEKKAVAMAPVYEDFKDYLMQ